jgi:hypothetical protein
MSSAKRVATSPAEKIPENKKITMLQRTPQASSQPPADPTKGSLVKFEVEKINDSPFYGTLSEIEIVYIWEKILGRSRDEIFAMTYNRSLTRNFRVTFKLTSQIETSSIYPEPTFVFQRKRQDSEVDFDTQACKIIGYSTVKPAEIGQLTRITVKTNEFTVDVKQIVPWLAKFGSVSSNYDFEKNSMGIRTDIFETEIVLKKHVPEFLPIAGRKVLVHYPGIPRGCNNCYQLGHLKRNCRSKKIDWIDRVAELLNSGEFEEELFEGWIPILAQRKPQKK